MRQVYYCQNKHRLRIINGPLGGKQVGGAGFIPMNEWVTFELIVMPDSIRILVNGDQRFYGEADFSEVDQPLAIFPAGGSVVKVKSVIATVPEK